MIDSASLVSALKSQVLTLEDDLRQRIADLAEVNDRWRAEYQRVFEAERTASSWTAWRDDRVTQAAVAWVLTSVFVRFCEDNQLVRPVWIAGPPERRQEALDARSAYFRGHPEDTDREWLLEAVSYFKKLPATAPLVDDHSPLWSVSPSGNAVTDLLTFWRECDDSGGLIFDFADPDWETRFLGDLYQDLSEHAKKTYALLQTPEFVEEFILDQTMEPALAERRLDGFSMIDPTCGSGHFLLGAFRRLLERWDRHAPNLDLQQRVQNALDSVHGVDINPFAVAIAKFRLTVDALKACGLKALENAPAFRNHLAVGDSLLFGRAQETLPIDGADYDEKMSSIAYSIEDLDQLKEILKPGQYDAIVGNPPYITVKDKQLNKAYRERYETCKGTYALTVPFMERFFDLAKRPRGDQPPGWVGQITSNSFMKREFGSKLIESFLANRDLRLIVDTSGAYIPGHGTPTVLIFGRNQMPVGVTVRAVLGIRGEPGRPEAADQGLVWLSIVKYLTAPGHVDQWISVADLGREKFAAHPWSLAGGAATQLLEQVNRSSIRLRDAVEAIGRTTHTGVDEAFFAPNASLKALHLEDAVVPVVLGEEVRDYGIRPVNSTIFPYDADGRPTALSKDGLRHLWRVRRVLETQLDYGETRAQRNLRWIDHSMFMAKRFIAPMVIPFAFVATHNHFVLDRGGKVFKQSAPVIKLPEGASEDDHLGLLGVLNSSTACFWLKQNSHNKGSTVDNRGARQTQVAWENFYEFTGTTLQDFPMPSKLPGDRAKSLDRLATELATHSPAEALPDAQTVDAALLKESQLTSATLRRRMIAEQEELDWAVYGLYGLPGGDLVYDGDDPPELELGERAFEIALARQAAAGDEATAWFARHRSTPITELPSHWPDAYRELVQRRLDLIAADQSVALLESPEHKRRWSSEPWEVQQEHALRHWLLDRLEGRRFWFAGPTPTPKSISQLADEVSRDDDLVSVLQLWEGRPDVPVVQSLTKLLTDEAVPFLAAYRLKESGLRKRAAWEETWSLQRQEDAGIDVGTIPVPPKYTSADFKKQPWWHARGKLDVPKERFILYPNAGRATDPTLLIGWAGWDHAEQALALASIISEREAEGRSDEDLVPLVAGLAELQPWVEQWHSDIHPVYGQSLATFCREQLAECSRQVNKSVEELAAWRPPAATRGRKAKV